MKRITVPPGGLHPEDIQVLPPRARRPRKSPRRKPRSSPVKPERRWPTPARRVVCRSPWRTIDARPTDGTATSRPLAGRSWSAVPKRIQQRRIPGWRKPDNTIVVGRWSKWANPFIVGEAGVPDAEAAVRLYRMFLGIPGNPLVALLPELHRNDLACWCPLDQPCHADVLLEFANHREGQTP
jgi:hypothetical protein